MPFYRLSKAAVVETFDDEGPVLFVPERRLVTLNPTAVEIVKLLDGNRTVAHWRPETKKFDVAKPFDLAIPHLEESKEDAFLD